MGAEPEHAALRELLAETEKLSDLSKAFYQAVTHDPRVKARQEARQASGPAHPLVLKPVGT